jgi:hypothetical protein
MDEEEDDIYVCNKTSFKKAFRLPEDSEEYQRIQNLSLTASHLLFHATHFFKYYVLSTENYDVIPSDKLLQTIFYLLNNDFRPRGLEERQIVADLRPHLNAYLEVMSNYTQPRISYAQQIILYLKSTLKTNLSVNVRMHFTKMYLRYINKRLEVKATMDGFGEDRTGRQLYARRLRELKELLCLNTGRGSMSFLPLTIEEYNLQQELQWVLPYDAPTGDPLAFNVAVDPLEFLPAYCRLARLYELYDDHLFGALPLRTKLTRMHVPIDTKILCAKVLCDYNLFSDMSDQKQELWDRLFRLNSKAFKSRSGYAFDGRIATDGVSVSVYLRKEGVPKRYGKKNRKLSKRELQERVRHQYFEHHIEELQGAGNIVVIDPNKRDLLYCRDMNTERTLRYTSNQREVETRSRKYQMIRERWKMEEGISDIESRIPTHKTMVLDSYVNYLQYRNEHLPRLEAYYNENDRHNKLKWNTYINRRRSEQSFINRFTEKYGQDVAVVMGDWSDAGRTMKYQTSTKTKGWQKVFRSNHIPFFLLDEFRTSTFCPRCEETRVVSTVYRPNPRPWRRGTVWKVHGLLRCNNANCIQQGCMWWNRDGLSTLNMLHIVRNVLAGQGRPERFCRG